MQIADSAALLLYSHDVLSRIPDHFRLTALFRFLSIMQKIRQMRKISYLYMESEPRALTLSRDFSPFCKYRFSLALCSGVMFAVLPSLDAQRVSEFSNWLNLLMKVLQLADRPVSVSFSQ